MYERLCAVSVDLDEVRCYTAIHGLADPPDRLAHAIYERALPRLLRLFSDEHIQATLFAIGRDLTHGPSAAIVADAHRQGHEIGNHSLNHLYDLSRREPSVVRAEIAGGIGAIERIIHERPIGFRAPGYTITDTMFDVLVELGAQYDSSVFPCPTYFAAKAVALGIIRLRGQQSQSLLDDPRVLLAPADPYRVGRPYWTRGSGLLELPIGVTRDVTLRLPYIGTSVVLAGARAAEALTRAMLGRSLVSLELHGIDLADAEADGLAFLRPYQPDLRRSSDAKVNALRAAIRMLRQNGYRFVTLAEAARHHAE